MNDSSINIEVKGLLNDLIEKMELKSKLDEKKKYMLTMQVSIDDNDVGKIVIPEDVKIDKIVSLSRDKYLEEIGNVRRKEIDNLKNEIMEINSKKMDMIFKNILGEYNKKIGDKIDKLFDDDAGSNINEKDMESSDTKSDMSSPFVRDMANKDEKRKNKNIGNNTVSNFNLENKRLDKFSDYYDCVYIINIPDERDKVNNLLTHLRELGAKIEIIDGVNAKDFKYLKYYHRWMYQKNLKGDVSKLMFDENIYLRKNKDLGEKYSSRIQLFNHWLKTGKKEGRKLYEKTEIKMDAQLGNLIAHINVLKHALRNKYSKILILEDDVYPNKNIDNLHEVLVKEVDNYDILYYGCIQKKWSDINFKKNIYVANNSYGSFAFALDGKMFTPLINMYEELVYPVEKCLMNIQKRMNSFVSYPNLFITDLENGKIHRKREFSKYSKHFRWDVSKYNM